MNVLVPILLQLVEHVFLGVDLTRSTSESTANMIHNVVRVAGQLTVLLGLTYGRSSRVRNFSSNLLLLFYKK